MFDDYSTKQLDNLRLLCAESIERTDEVQERADALLLLQYIEDELAARVRRKSA
jgi:hypothetical protein